MRMLWVEILLLVSRFVLSAFFVRDFAAMLRRFANYDLGDTFSMLSE